MAWSAAECQQSHTIAWLATNRAQRPTACRLKIAEVELCLMPFVLATTTGRSGCLPASATGKRAKGLCCGVTVLLQLGGKPLRHCCEESLQGAAEFGTGILALLIREAILFMRKANE